MLIAATEIVTEDNGPRPNGAPDRCFFCRKKVGQAHKHDCPLREKVVMVKVEMVVPIAVPSHWDAELTNFHFNGSSWCADNFVDDLSKYMEAKAEEECLCGQFTGEYVRDATEEDVSWFNPEKLKHQ